MEKLVLLIDSVMVTFAACILCYCCSLFRWFLWVLLTSLLLLLFCFMVVVAAAIVVVVTVGDIKSAVVMRLRRAYVVLRWRYGGDGVVVSTTVATPDGTGSAMYVHSCMIPLTVPYACLKMAHHRTKRSHTSSSPPPEVHADFFRYCVEVLKVLARVY